MRAAKTLTMLVLHSVACLALAACSSGVGSKEIGASGALGATIPLVCLKHSNAKEQMRCMNQVKLAMSDCKKESTIAKRRKGALKGFKLAKCIHDKINRPQETLRYGR